MAGTQCPKLFVIMAVPVMSISPIPLQIRCFVVRWIRNTYTHRHKCFPLFQVQLGAAVELVVFVGWLLRGSKRAKGTCWHNASTNNCLLLLVPQGEHFMEMAVQGGQRCDKATGKMSFLDSPTIPISVIPCLVLQKPQSFSIQHMC